MLSSNTWQPCFAALGGYILDTLANILSEAVAGAISPYRVQMQADGHFIWARIANPMQSQPIAHVRDLVRMIRCLPHGAQRRRFEGVTACRAGVLGAGI